MRILSYLRLHRDWKRILRLAWSIRLILLAGLLSGLDAALYFAGGIYWLPPGVLIVLVPVVACAALIARLIAQKNMED